MVYGKSGGLKLDLTVVPGDAIDVRTDVSWLTGFGVTVTVSETTASGVKRTLGSKTVSFPGLVTLPVRPSVNKITLTVDNMSSFVTVSPTGIFSIAGVSYDSLAYWSQWSPVTICDKNVDKYPFGFNGQMKSNDVAGIGNFNTAEFWEYNTRTGRRLNPDPVVHPWESRYATFGSNPIAHSDVKGDDWYKDSKTGMTVHSKEIGSQKDLNKKGIKGEYLGKTIKGHEPNGKGVFGDEDGVATYSLSTVTCKSGNNASVFGFGSSGDYNVVQAYRRNIADNLELRLRMDAIQHGMVGCLWAGLVAGPAAGAGLFGMSAELCGAKAALSFGMQATVNGVGEVDYADVAGDAFTAPGLNAIWSPGVDFRPFTKNPSDVFRVQGVYNSKSNSQFLTDGIIGFAFGVMGDATYAPLKPLLNRTSEQTIFYLSTQMGISAGQQITGKLVSESQVRNENKK